MKERDKMLELATLVVEAINNPKQTSLSDYLSAQFGRQVNLVDIDDNITKFIFLIKSRSKNEIVLDSLFIFDDGFTQIKSKVDKRLFGGTMLENVLSTIFNIEKDKSLFFAAEIITMRAIYAMLEQDKSIRNEEFYTPLYKNSLKINSVVTRSIKNIQDATHRISEMLAARGTRNSSLADYESLMKYIALELGDSLDLLCSRVYITSRLAEAMNGEETSLLDIRTEISSEMRQYQEREKRNISIGVEGLELDLSSMLLKDEVMSQFESLKNIL